jgi:hypothetical protein
MMLPNIPKEKRIDFVMKMIDTLMEQGCVGLSEEEKKDFVEKIIEKLDKQAFLNKSNVSS